MASPRLGLRATHLRQAYPYTHLCFGFFILIKSIEEALPKR